MKNSNELLLRLLLEVLAVPQGLGLRRARSRYGSVVNVSLGAIVCCIGASLLVPGMYKFLCLAIQLIATGVMCFAISRRVQLEELTESRFGAEVEKLSDENASARKIKEYVDELKRPMVFGDLLRMRRIVELEGTEPIRPA